LPRVSVIIPTFNRVDLLKRALKSVLFQSFSDFEVIVIDDASTDSTKDYLETLEDHRLVVLSLPENSGVSAARNAGIKIARGDYIALLDSDDEWRKKKLEKQMAYLDEHSECTVVHCNERWIRRGEHLNQKKIHKKEGGDIFKRALHLCLISPSAVLIEREYLYSIGLFREDYPVCEDYELWLRVTANNQIGFLEDSLVIKYGGHDDQLSQRYKAMDYWRVKAMDEVADSGILDAEKYKELKIVITTKCRILKAGYEKHQNLGALEYVESLLQKYGE
jgi:glycosyltransferase involved in cell wall biosynthesis